MKKINLKINTHQADLELVLPSTKATRLVRKFARNIKRQVKEWNDPGRRYEPNSLYHKGPVPFLKIEINPYE